LSKDETEELLQNILELLAAADEWSMSDLKDELETAIIHTHDLIQRAPHLFDESKLFTTYRYLSPYNLTGTF